MKKKIVFWLFFVIVLTTIIGAKYVYKPHRNVQKEEAKYQLSAEEIMNQFLNNPQKASQKYLNEVILVTGEITETNNDGLMLNEVVFFQFENYNDNEIKIQQTVKIKGRCIGYDDLLEIVKMDQSTLYIN